MDIPQELLVAAAMLGAAFLYSSVGHGGGSAYLAVMALFGFAPGVMKPTALSLNVLVASIAAWRFHRAGHFSWPLFWPFAAASVPAAFLGGALTLPGDLYRLVVGALLLFAAVRLAAARRPSADGDEGRPILPLALAAGGAIGFLSGLVGVGGGIFLSPILIVAGWATPHTTAGVAALFILVNSGAGLAGHLFTGVSLPAAIPLWAAAVLGGGWIGAAYGVRVSKLRMRRLLAVVLVVAAGKFFLG